MNWTKSTTSVGLTASLLIGSVLAEAEEPKTADAPQEGSSRSPPTTGKCTAATA